MGREYLLFFVFNGIAMLISLTCLWVSHYLLGLDTPLADNISANVVGLILGTMFRFFAYRTWVFPAVPDDAADQELAERDAATPI
jgi:putative flippase GtrA